MAKTEEKSIKYCARKCHNGGPLSKMMAAAASVASAAAAATENRHTKKFCSRTIVVAMLLQLLRHFRSLVVTSAYLLLKPHIKLSGAQIQSLSPHFTYRLLLTVVTLASSVSAASSYKDDEGKNDKKSRVFTCYPVAFPTTLLRHQSHLYQMHFPCIMLGISRFKTNSST